MSEPKLPHCERMLDLLRRKGVTEAKRAHSAHVKAQFDAVRQGQVINLSDLMAAKEEIDLAEPAEPGQQYGANCRKSSVKGGSSP